MELWTVILAGGQSRRMGRDKAALPFEGGTMLTRLVERLGAALPVAVSVGQAGRYATAGAREIVDLHPGQGPLAGLEAAFRTLPAEGIFLTGTDLPFLSPELVLALAECARRRPEYDAWVLRRRDGKAEPLCALYSRRCLPAVERCLAEGRRSFKGLFAQVSVYDVEEEELPGFDLERQLDNLNTPEDYCRATGKTVDGSER